MIEPSAEATSALRQRIESAIRRDLIDTEEILRAYRWGTYSGITTAEGTRAIVDWIGALQNALLALADEIADIQKTTDP